MNKLLIIITSTLIITSCAHHPVDCAIGIPWKDCLEGTAGYENGGGEETREYAKKLEDAKKQSKKDNLYSELIKLDDLRKRGILTEDEYNGQKKKLLEKKYD